MRDKKAAISGELLQMIPRIVFLIVVLFSVVLLVKMFITTSINVREAEAYIFSERLLYGKGGLSYVDANGRTYPGIIEQSNFEDISKNNPNRLDSLFAQTQGADKILAAKITLIWGNSQLVAYYSKEQYERREPRALSTVRGGSARVESFSFEYPILLQDAKGSVAGKLRIQVMV